MKDLPYIKPIYCEDTKIYMVDYDNVGWAGTDIFRGEVKLDKTVSVDDIYEDFLEVIDKMDTSGKPVQLRKIIDVDLKNEKAMRRLRSLISISYEYIRKNSQFGAPSFIIINTELYSIMSDFIDKFKIEVITDDKNTDIILGKKNDNNLVKPGIYLYYRGDEYSVQPVGIRCKNQYIKLKLNLKNKS